MFVLMQRSKHVWKNQSKNRARVIYNDSCIHIIIYLHSELARFSKKFERSLIYLYIQKSKASSKILNNELQIRVYRRKYEKTQRVYSRT